MGREKVSAWNVPFHRNPFFTGREPVFTRIHDLLHAGKATALSQPPAISGLGGIGKTQTAVEYAYRYRDSYQYVLWVQANDHETLLLNFVAFEAVSFAVNRQWLLQEPSRTNLQSLPQSAQVPGTGAVQ